MPWAITFQQPLNDPFGKLAATSRRPPKSDQDDLTLLAAGEPVPLRHEPLLVDLALFAIGKALYLANHYEASCKHILRIGNLVRGIEQDPDASLDELVANLAADRMLGGVLHDLKTRFPELGGSQAEVHQVLNAGREGRNFVAHEGGLLSDLESPREVLAEHLSRLRFAVWDVAQADNIVSAWAYEICEKEPAPRHWIAEYPSRVDSWIFGGVERAFDTTLARQDYREPAVP